MIFIDKDSRKQFFVTFGMDTLYRERLEKVGVTGEYIPAKINHDNSYAQYPAQFITNIAHKPAIERLYWDICDELNKEYNRTHYPNGLPPEEQERRIAEGIQEVIE